MLVMCVLAYRTFTGVYRQNMPVNGETNKRLGLYKTLCCGTEMIIADGMVFPDCPKHPKLPTKWKSLVDERIRHVTELFPHGGKNKKGSAA